MAQDTPISVAQTSVCTENMALLAKAPRGVSLGLGRQKLAALAPPPQAFPTPPVADRSPLSVPFLKGPPASSVCHHLTSDSLPSDSCS